MPAKKATSFRLSEAALEDMRYLTELTGLNQVQLLEVMLSSLRDTMRRLETGNASEGQFSQRFQETKERLLNQLALMNVAQSTVPPPTEGGARKGPFPSVSVASPVERAA